MTLKESIYGKYYHDRPMAVAIAGCGNHSIFRMANPEVLSTGVAAALQTTWIKAEPRHDQAIRPSSFHPAGSSMRYYQDPYGDIDSVEIRVETCREDLARAAQQCWRKLTSAELDDLYDEIIRVIAASEWDNMWLKVDDFITVASYYSHE